MPIYDYVCTACDHRADILHGINDPGPNFCPSCGKEGTMRKLFSAPSIHFSAMLPAPVLAEDAVDGPRVVLEEV